MPGKESRSRWKNTQTPTLAVCLFFGKYMARHWKELAVSLVLLIGTVALTLARPWPLKVIFDYVLIPQETAGTPLDFLAGYDSMTVVILACAAVLVIALAGGLCEYSHMLLAGEAGQRIIYTIRGRLFAHIQRLSLSYHNRSNSGDLLARLIKEVNELRNFLTDSVIALVGDILLVVGLLAVMSALNLRLTLLSVALFPLLFILMAHFSGRIQGLTRKRLQREGMVASVFTETLAAIQDVQLYSTEEQEQRRFRSQSRASLEAGLRTMRAKGKLLRSVEIIAAGGTCLVLAWGTRSVISGGMTPGDLLVFLSYLKSLFKPIRHIANLSVQASRAIVSAERVMEVLRTEPEIQDRPDAVAAPQFRGEIEFRDVSFEYETGKEVLRGLNFRVEPGQTVALVGHSGAGKTTLASLIPRLYDPTKGRVLVDGSDIRAYTIASLRDQVAVVPQNPVLFGTSVSANIAYGDPDATDDRIERAARLARAHEFIKELPDGYDTQVGERGVRLSGGQRQRIAIARALLREAPIVILDEPMTGVDLEAESEILDALDNLLREKTAFVIAHRLSTVRNADLMIVLERGAVSELGSPRDLLRDGVHVQRLLDLEYRTGPDGKPGHRPAWGLIQ